MSDVIMFCGVFFIFVCFFITAIMLCHIFIHFIMPRGNDFLWWIAFVCYKKGDMKEAKYRLIAAIQGDDEMAAAVKKAAEQQNQIESEETNG